MAVIASRQGAMSGLRLLALDGGGIRGLSELCILDLLMTKLHQELGLPSTTPLKPCEVFDMIAGTSTGGLIAIMLGRLRMTVRECIDNYSKFAEAVFGDPVSKLRFQDGQFKASNLERAVRDIVTKQGQGQTMFDDRPEACKVFVCAIAAASINHARRLRTYDRSTIGECTIVEVARATSAAPTFFEPAEITINGTKERFVDGALGFNNPAWELYAEAKTVFPGRNIDCLVSLGTGSTIRGSLRQPRLWERIIPKNVIDALKLVTVNCEHIHERMLQHFEHELDIYFRFNVDAGLEGIRLQEWQKLSEVQSVTIDYLTGFAVKSRLTKAAALLKQPPIQSQRSAESIIEPLYPDLMPEGLQVETITELELSRDYLDDRADYLLLASANARDLMTFKQSRKTVQSDNISLKNTLEALLSRLEIDPTSLYSVRESKSVRHPGTCEWINGRGEFKDWLAGGASPILLVVAPPGCGKSTLAKYALEQISRTCALANNTIVLDYFCQDTHGSNTAMAITKSLLYQLFDNDIISFESLGEQHRRLLSQKSEVDLESLWQVLTAGLRTPAVDSVFCVIDGLDECEEASQHELWDLLEKHILEDSVLKAKLRILLTSRPTAIARRIGLLTNQVEVHRSDVDPDIAKYIDYRIDRMTKAMLLPPDASHQTKSFLDAGAEGMFLWARLSLDHLEDCDDCISYDTLPHMLEEVPRNVKGLYARALERINSNHAYLDRAQSIFEILLCAEEYFSVQGLALVMAEWSPSSSTHVEAMRHCDLRFEYTAKRVCGSLIKIEDGMIQLCHHSARQFLREEAPSLGFMVRDSSAGHARLASVCLSYLLLEDVEIPQGEKVIDLDRFPLLDYALSYWPLHVSRAGEVIYKYADLLQRFFGIPNFDRFKACLYCWRHDAEELVGHDQLGSEVVTHALAFYGLANVLRIISFSPHAENAENPIHQPIMLNTAVDGRDPNGNTALMSAAKLGFVECCQILLAKGASASARGQGGYTALHLAVIDSQSEVVRLLVSSVDNVNCVADDGSTPLHYAAKIDVVDVLLGASANLEARDKNGTTPLTFAAGGLGVDLARALLDRGAQVDTVNDHGWAPIHAAAKAGDAAILRLLLERKTSHHPPPFWNGAVRLASLSGSTKSVQMLVSHGFDPKSESAYGSLSAAASYGYTDIVHVLLSCGVNPQLTSQQHPSPLKLACERGDVGAVSALLEAGAPVVVISDSDESALHRATGNGFDNVLECLVQHGAPIEAKSLLRKQTPLVTATFYRWYKCMDILLKAGADAFEVDVYGFSALEYSANAAGTLTRMATLHDKHQATNQLERASLRRRLVRSNLTLLLQRQKGILAAADNDRILDHASVDLICRGLLFLKEYEMARTLVLIANRKWYQLGCDLCDKDCKYQKSAFGICTICAWDICKKCLHRYPEPRAPDDRLCEGHEILMITQSAYDELEPKNNASKEKERVVLARWLAEMREQFGGDQDQGSAEGDERTITQE